MTIPAWQPLAVEDGERWREARKQAHNALQWLVRMAHSYRPHEPGNAHALLTFDPVRGAFQTGQFLGKFAMELRLPALEMQFLENGRHVPHILDMSERTPAKLEAWILVELLHRGIDRDRFSKALPYNFPSLMSGDAVEYSPELLQPELALMSTWLRNAAVVHEGLDPDAETDFTCWPETFLIGREIAGDVRVALSLGEEAEPSFVVTPANGAQKRMPSFKLPVSRIVSGKLGSAEVADQLLTAISGAEKSKAKTR